MTILRKFIFQRSDNRDYPYSLSLLHRGLELDLNASVIFLVGENGSGKSTILELIATRLNLIRISQDLHYNDPEFRAIKEANKYLKLDYKTKPKGFFFRSEDFLSYIRYLEQAVHEANEALSEIELNYHEKSNYSKALASMPHHRTINDIKGLYQKILTNESHGEAYLDFFKSRIKPNSLYLLDEAEVPLSVQNQLSLMVLIKEAIDQGCQFMIASHSPVLMSFPQAKLYQLSNEMIQLVEYEAIESVQLMKDFLLNKDRYLNYLFK